MDKQYTVKEVAELLKKGMKTIRKYCHDGVIKGVQSPTGTWLIPEQALNAYLHPGEPVPKEAGYKAQQIKDETDVIKAEQEKIALSLGFKTAEDYQEASKELAEAIENQDAKVAEAIQAEKDKIVEATEKAEQAIIAYREQSEDYKESLAICRKQESRIEELEGLLGIQKEEEAKLDEEQTYFTEHLAEGIRILKITAKSILPYHKALANYLNKQAIGLQNETDAEFGIEAFNACSGSIVKIAGWFRVNEKVIQNYDAGEKANYLLDKAALIETTMRIPDDRLGSAEDEDGMKGKFQPMRVPPPVDNFLSRIMAKISGGR